MPARKTRPAGSRPDKLMRDALALELSVDIVEGKGKSAKKVKKLRLVARRLITNALDGDTAAIKEIFDRMDGRVAQALMARDETGEMTLADLVSVSFEAGRAEGKKES